MTNKKTWIFVVPVLIALITLNFWIKNKDDKTIPHPKTSFIYDVLAPMGMPIVTKFHHVRDNVFLNTASEQASGLETAGNFFLSPSRFLFGGVNVDENSYDTTPSFSYHENLGLKTFVSFVSVIPGQVIGSTLKGLSMFSKETKKRHKTIIKNLFSTEVVSNASIYEEHNLPRIYSTSFAPCQRHARNSVLSTKLQTELNALKDIIRVLDQKAIPYWADAGTLLGAYRYGGAIPWDCDVDLAILELDHDNVKNALRLLDPNKYEVQDWSSYGKPKSFIKLFVKESGSHIDFYHYKMDPENKTLTFDYTFVDTPLPESWKECDTVMIRPHDYSTIFPLKNAHFDGMVLRVPNDTVRFLHTLFGKNLDPTMVWNESTSVYEKVDDHPYWRHDNTQ